MTQPDEQRDEELAEQRRQMAQGQPGGSASRGPETQPPVGDTEAQGPLPPYDMPDSSGAKAAAQEGVQKAFRADEFGGEPGSEPPISKEEREGVPPTDTTAATPLGVGESSTAGGEEAGGGESGRMDTGTEGRTDRPTGGSTGSDVTGVNPSGGRTHEDESPPAKD